MTTVTTMMLNIQLLECISCCTINAAYKCIKNLKIVSTFQSANTTSLQNKHFVDVTTYTLWKCVFLHTDLCKGQRSPRSAPPSWSSRSCSCTWALQPGSRCSSGSACEFSPDRWGTLLWRPQLQRGHKRSLFRYWWPVKRVMSGWHKLSNCLCGGIEILTFRRDYSTVSAGSVSNQMERTEQNLSHSSIFLHLVVFLRYKLNHGWSRTVRQLY